MSGRIYVSMNPVALSHLINPAEACRPRPALSPTGPADAQHGPKLRGEPPCMGGTVRCSGFLDHHPTMASEKPPREEVWL